MLKKITYLIGILSLIGCKQREPYNPPYFYHENFGKYLAIEMRSNEPIDADNDGLYSTDVIYEFQKYIHRDYNGVTLGVAKRGENKMYIDLALPYMKRPAQTTLENYIVYLVGRFDAQINAKGTEILKSTPMQNTDGTSTETELIDFRIIDKNTLELTFKHNRIYDVKQKKWKKIEITAIYQKIEQEPRPVN